MEPNGSNSVRVPARVRVKHVILFGIACILLGITLSAGWDLLHGFLLAEPPAYPSDDGTGMGWFGVFLGESVRGFALFILLAAAVPVWLGGTVISFLLVLNRGDKPRALWVASVVLLILYLAVPVALLAVWAACGS